MAIDPWAASDPWARWRSPSSPPRAECCQQRRAWAKLVDAQNATIATLSAALVAKEPAAVRERPKVVDTEHITLPGVATEELPEVAALELVVLAVSSVPFTMPEVADVVQPFVAAMVPDGMVDVAAGVLPQVVTWDPNELLELAAEELSKNPFVPPSDATSMPSAAMSCPVAVTLSSENNLNSADLDRDEGDDMQSLLDVLQIPIDIPVPEPTTESEVNNFCRQFFAQQAEKGSIRH